MSPAQTEEADKVERGHPQFVRPITTCISWINRTAKSPLSEAQLYERPSLAQSTHTTRVHKLQVQAGGALGGAMTIIKLGILQPVGEPRTAHRSGTSGGWPHFERERSHGLAVRHAQVNCGLLASRHSTGG